MDTKETAKDIVKSSKGFIKEFKEFISRGNVMDMAVGVIIGGAFTAIVNSLVNDIFNPLLGLITGGADFSTLSFGFMDAQFMYGSFITAVINFLLVALVLFLVIKAMNKLHLKKTPRLPPPPPPRCAPSARARSPSRPPAAPTAPPSWRRRRSPPKASPKKATYCLFSSCAGPCFVVG